MTENSLLKQLNWGIILLYLTISVLGWFSIYSAVVTEYSSSIFDLSFPYGKQLLFFEIGWVIGFLILILDTKIYENFAFVFYILILIVLLSLFLFGKTVSGSTSWFDFFGFGIQPSEIAKFCTALAVSKYLSNSQTYLKTKSGLFKVLIIIFLPVLCIILQPDIGTAIIFFSFVLVLFKEGLPITYLLVSVMFMVVFILTLKFGIPITVGLSMGVCFLVYIFTGRKKSYIFPIILGILSVFLIAYSGNFVFENVFKQHHRNRLSLWLNLDDKVDNILTLKKTIGYNIYQSQSAISSGGFTGKGFLKGTRTKGNFIPEQHTDYIFSSVGEEWGFLGSSFVLVLYLIFLLRLFNMAEKQKSRFSKIYGYCVVSIFFVHISINIGMVIGLLPTVGIPLPFVSYGGSAYISFTILLFIFLKLDANRRNDWLL